jgi:site-specific recombinase XerD
MSTLPARIDHFLNTLNRSENTVAAYRYALQRFIAVVGEDAQLTTETYVKFLMAIRKKSPSTSRVWRTAVGSFYAFENAGNVLEMKAATKHYTRDQGDRIVHFNRDAIEKVIAYSAYLGESLMALRDTAFILTLVDTGLRISEACHLKRGDIDWREHRAIVVGKGDKQAVVRFSKRAIEALKSYHRACAKIEPNSRTPLSSQPVFMRHDIRASKKIRPINDSGMWMAIKGRIRDAGVDPSLVRIHDFRHYFITITYLAEGNLKLSQELARHKSIAMTGRYTHFGDEADRIYEKIFNESKKESPK